MPCGDQKLEDKFWGLVLGRLSISFVRVVLVFLFVSCSPPKTLSGVEGGRRHRGGPQNVPFFGCIVFFLFRYKIQKVFPPHMSSPAAFLVPLDLDLHEPSIAHFLISPEKHTSFPVAAQGHFGMCRPEVNATWSDVHVPKGDLTCNQICGNQRHDAIRLSDPAGGCDLKTAVGSSVLAHDQQGPAGRTPARQSYPQSERDRRRGGCRNQETNSTSLPRKAGERQKRFQTEIDKRIRFQGQEQIVIGVFNVKANSVFNSELCRKGFGRIPFFWVPFFVPVFQFAVPFFFRLQFRLQFRFSVFSVSSSVCCSKVPEYPFIGYVVEGKGIRAEGAGFLGLRVPGLKV